MHDSNSAGCFEKQSAATSLTRDFLALILPEQGYYAAFILQTKNISGQKALPRSRTSLLDLMLTVLLSITLVRALRRSGASRSARLAQRAFGST
jgi:hypothetical protein